MLNEIKAWNKSFPNDGVTIKTEIRQSKMINSSFIRSCVLVSFGVCALYVFLSHFLFLPNEKICTFSHRVFNFLVLTTMAYTDCILSHWKYLSFFSLSVLFIKNRIDRSFISSDYFVYFLRCFVVFLSSSTSSSSMLSFWNVCFWIMADMWENVPSKYQLINIWMKHWLRQKRKRNCSPKHFWFVRTVVDGFRFVMRLIFSKMTSVCRCCCCCCGTSAYEVKNWWKIMWHFLVNAGTLPSTWNETFHFGRLAAGLIHCIPPFTLSFPLCLRPALVFIARSDQNMFRFFIKINNVLSKMSLISIVCW